MFYEPWFLCCCMRAEEYYVVPRRAIVDREVEDCQSMMDFKGHPLLQDPVGDFLDVLVDLGVEDVHLLASPGHPGGTTARTLCRVMYFACDREEVKDMFHTCVTLALSSTHPKTEDPKFISKWLKRKDQDDVAKALAKKKGITGWMGQVTHWLRRSEGEVLYYHPDDTNVFEKWLIPSQHTPEKLYYSSPHLRDRARVRLKL
ncbi:hypothetical protein FOCC_FOCC016639 [Frankliniella occidentalis]|uniref:Uncharacterized protein LOC113214466 n=1 Tax=Frankliniella occidentalis TaxID=133901 RepID=A0A9C6X9B7_FRAOC|nr:uncharacterized protein LOC113214466 [Frankliniella occidentalis]KAE8737891.1 hypothetical protein FOCC_FOCC016639 [Frankliniella occidentalis]